MTTRPDTIRDTRALDAIDAAHLIDAWSASDAKPAMFEAITSGRMEALAPDDSAATVRSPRRRRWTLTAAVTAAALALAVVPGIFRTTGTPAYAITERADGVLEIDVSAKFRDADALAAELRAYGVDVRIVTMVASPSRVGEVEVFGPEGGETVPEGLTFGKDGSADVFRWTIDPRVFDERLTIQLAVEAREGERYALSTIVFEAGEALAGVHCALGRPLRAEDLVPHLERRGLTPVWTLVRPTDDPAVTQSERVARVPDGEVLTGVALDDSTVRFDVVPDGVTLSHPTPAALFDEVPC